MQLCDPFTEWNNNRIQELDIQEGTHVAFYGDGVLRGPECVAVTESNTCMAVSEQCADVARITLLRLGLTGELLKFDRLGSPDTVQKPRGLRFTSRGKQLLVADEGIGAVLLFDVDTGAPARVVCNGLRRPVDLFVDGNSIFVATYNNGVAHVARDDTGA